MKMSSKTFCRTILGTPLSATENYARIRWDGKVEVVYINRRDLLCEMDVRDFPFDEQICSLDFGSWSFDSAHLYLYPEAPTGGTSYLETVNAQLYFLIQSPCPIAQMISCCIFESFWSPRTNFLFSSFYYCECAGTSIFFF